MSRVAIMHFTGPPAIGGIETTIGAQVNALRELEVDVRLIVGSGDQVNGSETVSIPELHPADARVTVERGLLTTRFPDRKHLLVRGIAAGIDDALRDCTACWVHNAFTVYLNPFLTVALWQLVQRRPDVKWVAWCEDLTGASVFQTPLAPCDEEAARRAVPGVTCVTVSRARRAELSTFLRMPHDDIRVIEPPLDLFAWLGVSAETRQIAGRVGLEGAAVVAVVPAKLLPHKGLQRVCRVAACLQEVVERPLVVITGAPSLHEPQVSRDLAALLGTLITDNKLEGVVYLLSDASGQPPSARAVRELMMLSDVVLLPSEEEGFGVPLREAAAVRAPVLCSDTPVFREVAGSTGRFFGARDTDMAVARVIVEMAGMPVNAARRRVLRSMDRFKEQVAELL